MKKSLSILLASVFAAAMFAGCSSKSEKPATTTPGTTTSSNGVVKLGLGHITKIDSSTDLGTKDGKDVLPTGQVNTVIAAVGFDKDGKVQKISFDFAQTKVNFDKTMKITSDIKTPAQTKKELGAKYGMLSASKIKKEWFQQAAALEDWMKGKTVADIKALKTKTVGTESGVPDNADLTSSVSISVTDFIAAVDEASQATVAVTGDVDKVGLGHVVSLASSKSYGTDSAGKEVLPVAQTDTSLVAAAFDKDGKVLTAIVDNCQTKVAYSKDGKVTSDKTALYQSKDELKEKYGMLVASKIKKEWYQQADALAKWMVGKTASQIKSLKTKTVGTETGIADDAELTSSVSISVTDYIAAAAEAYSYAK
ncbi:MAG: hypothetical protein Q8930_03890 [Bacillota bacterium]|nr:hypothetical protein [Bacillota bacterium]